MMKMPCGEFVQVVKVPGSLKSVALLQGQSWHRRGHLRYVLTDFFPIIFRSSNNTLAGRQRVSGSASFEVGHITAVLVMTLVVR